jgi:hypothetical protein
MLVSHVLSLGNASCETRQGFSALQSRAVCEAHLKKPAFRDSFFLDEGKYPSKRRAPVLTLFLPYFQHGKSQVSLGTPLLECEDSGRAVSDSWVSFRPHLAVCGVYKV